MHIPWCVRKCPYCDFNSHQAGAEIPEREYIAALERDLMGELAFVQGRQLTSIFFGGGTPSLLSVTGISDILSLVARYIPFANDMEITLEANPGTVEQGKFQGLFRAGVNRLSIGVQSFQPDQLNALGRIHSGDEAHTAIESAIASGFNRINVDLMHGLPNQSTDDALHDLTIATDFAIDHLSWYQLTIEPNTHFYSKPPVLPVEDTLADIQDAGSAFLVDRGFVQYEVSAFARNESNSRHNLNYWQFGDYLGIGAGAHGKVTNLATGTIYRRQKTRLPDHFIQAKNPLTGCDAIQPQQLLLEFCMNSLRLTQGVDKSLYRSCTGQEWPSSAIQNLVDQGLLVDSPDRIVATALGQRFLNHLLSEIDDLAGAE